MVYKGSHVSVHQPLKSSQRITQPNGHLSILKETKRSNMESGLRFVTFPQLHLPISDFQVRSGKEFGTGKCMYCDINARYGISILSGMLIQFSVFYTETNRPMTTPNLLMECQASNGCGSDNCRETWRLV